jgi:hypothetical protein
MGKPSMMTVALRQVPLKGKTQNSQVEVPMTATTVGAMAKALKLDLKNRSVSINGTPATADTIVAANAKVEIRLTERPQGS